MLTVSDLTSNQPNIKSNDIISTADVSNVLNISHLNQALKSLLDIVTTNINAYGAYDHDSDISHINNPDVPQQASIISASEIDVKKALINSLGNDCICYADCTNFAKWKKFVCSCNVDCRCNYFYYDA